MSFLSLSTVQASTAEEAALTPDQIHVLATFIADAMDLFIREGLEREEKVIKFLEKFGNRQEMEELISYVFTGRVWAFLENLATEHTKTCAQEARDAAKELCRDRDLRCKREIYREAYEVCSENTTAEKAMERLERFFGKND